MTALCIHCLSIAVDAYFSFWKTALVTIILPLVPAKCDEIISEISIQKQTYSFDWED